MKGRIVGPAIGKMLQITIDGDPFSVNVPQDQVTLNQQGKKIKVPTATKSAVSRKELRKQADALGIDGWDTMTTDELEKAIAKATRSDSKPSKNGHKPAKAAKKTAKAKPPVDEDDDDEDEDEEEEEVPAPKARKSSAKKATKLSGPVAKEVSENGNPFRKGSNLYLITEELLKGGRRASMIERLMKKIELHPWAKKAKDIDPVFEMDKRILLTKNLLSREYGFTFETTGRGPENGTIKAVAPGAVKAPKAAKKTAKAEVEPEEKPTKKAKGRKKGKNRRK